MESKINTMIKVINTEIKFVNEEYEPTSEDYKRARAKVRGMLDMLEIVSGKCYIAEVFNTMRGKKMNCIKHI